MGTGYLDQLKQEAFEVNMGIVREMPLHLIEQMGYLQLNQVGFLIHY